MLQTSQTLSSTFAPIGLITYRFYREAKRTQTLLTNMKTLATKALAILVKPDLNLEAKLIGPDFKALGAQLKNGAIRLVVPQPHFKRVNRWLIGLKQKHPNVINKGISIKKVRVMVGGAF